MIQKFLSLLSIAHKLFWKIKQFQKLKNYILKAGIVRYLYINNLKKIAEKAAKSNIYIYKM